MMILFEKLLSWWTKRRARRERQRRFDTVTEAFLREPELMEKVPTHILRDWIRGDSGGRLTLFDEHRE